MRAIIYERPVKDEGWVRFKEIFKTHKMFFHHVTIAHIIFFLYNKMLAGNFNVMK